MKTYVENIKKWTTLLYLYSKRANGAIGMHGLHAQHHLGTDVIPEPAIATTQHSSSMVPHVLNLKWKLSLVAVVSSFEDNLDY